MFDKAQAKIRERVEGLHDRLSERVEVVELNLDEGKPYRHRRVEAAYMASGEVRDGVAKSKAHP